MARELGPQGIHVAHVVIDGPIETKFVRERFGSENFEHLKASEGLLQPDTIAEAYSFIHHQPRNAWVFEMDLRPYSESHAS
jgi:NADP-dependent 3-hydroxy acid dehydrogenase YdfG